MSIEMSTQNAQEGQLLEQTKLPQHQSSHEIALDGKTKQSEIKDESHQVDQKKSSRGGRRLGDIAAAPFNGLAHMLGGQSFLPMTMEKECEKASKVLQTFCSMSKAHTFQGKLAN